MNISDSGVSFVPRSATDEFKRKLVIRLVVLLSATGILIVLARWLLS